MEKNHIEKNTYSPKTISNKLYYKKKIYKRKKIISSLGPINTNQNYTQVSNFKIPNFPNFQNVKANQINNERNKKIFHTMSSTNLSLKYLTKKFPYQKQFIYYNNIKSIIFIQKNIKAFLLRKKFKNINITIPGVIKNKKFIKKKELSFINKSNNSSILDAVKNNSYKQKNYIKISNNKLNSDRNMYTYKNKTNYLFRKNIVFMPKNKNHFSLEHAKKIENEIKTYRQTNIIYNLDKNNNFHETFSKEETNFNTNIKSVNSKLLKDSDNNDFNSFQKKFENNHNCSFSLSELSLSNEQCPQNVNNINSDEIIENDDKEEKNLNVNNEYFQNENNNIKSQREKNTLCNNKNLNNLVLNENKKKLILPNFVPNHLSRNYTKENNSLEKNLENDVLGGTMGTDSSHNIHAKEIFFNIKKNNNKYHQIKKIKSERLKKINKNKSKEKKKNKKIRALKNLENNKYKVIKRDYNSINSKNNDNQILNDNKNINEYVFKNYCNNIIINNPNNNNSNKRNKIFESIKEENQKESENNDIKSSFYENEDFAIISYDYTLNDKKNVLSIANVENLNIKGGISKKFKFIRILKNLILKNNHKFIFNFLKNLKLGENDIKGNEYDTSITINDSCSFIPPKRIEKKKIIFEYAKIDIENNNNEKLHNNKSNIRYYLNN